MRPHFLTVAAFLFIAASASADVHFAQTVIDVGEVKAGLPLMRRFHFSNTGGETAHIIEVRASCGCLVPRLERRSFGPGEEGALLMEVHTLGQPAGPHTWTARVICRSGEQTGEIPLQLSARVVREVSVQPAELTIIADGPVQHEIRVSDLRLKRLAVRSATASSSKLQVRVFECPFANLDCAAWIVRIAVADDCPPGRYNESVVIHTDDPEYGALTVPVTLVKRDRSGLSVLPASVSVTVASDQPVPSQILLVRSNDGREVVVERVIADHPALTCTWARGPGVNATVKVQFDRQKIDSTSSQTSVRIHVRAPAEQVLSVPVSCQLK